MKMIVVPLGQGVEVNVQVPPGQCYQRRYMTGYGTLASVEWGPVMLLLYFGFGRCLGYWSVMVR